MANAFQDKIQDKNTEENKDNEEDKNEEDDEEDEENEEGEKEYVTMMPMADMLNHKTGFNNVCPSYNTSHFFSI